MNTGYVQKIFSVATCSKVCVRETGEILSSRDLTLEDNTLLIAHKAECFRWWPQASGEPVEGCCYHIAGRFSLSVLFSKCTSVRKAEQIST